MARIKTYAAGSPLLPGELDAMQDDYEQAFKGYRSLHIDLGAGAKGVYTSGDRTVAPKLLDGNNLFWFHLDPAAIGGSPRLPRFRLRAVMLTGQVSPGTVTFTFRVAPVTVAGYGTSGNESTYSVGTAVAGSTVTFTNPGANYGPTAQVSSDFAIATAGMYAVVLNASANTASGSCFDARADLQYRQV